MDFLKHLGKIQQSGCRLLVARFMFTPVIGLFLCHLSVLLANIDTGNRPKSEGPDGTLTTFTGKCFNFNAGRALRCRNKKFSCRKNKSVSHDPRPKSSRRRGQLSEQNASSSVLLINERNHRIGYFVKEFDCQ
jgi:hypothetical protein